MNYSEKQYDEFIDRLHKKYPEMFTQPYGGVVVGPGWWPIVETLCELIHDYTEWRKLPPVVVTQIKEKFGGLRFYHEGGDEHIAGLVAMSEAMTSFICEECGSLGKRRSGGWIRTLCDEHEAERQAKMHPVSDNWIEP